MLKVVDLNGIKGDLVIVGFYFEEVKNKNKSEYRVDIFKLIFF